MRLLRAAGWTFEPLVAAVFIALWINAEAGRQLTGLVAFLGLGLAIGVSRRFPIVALGLVGATLLLQLFGVGTFQSTDWPANLGIPLVVGLATARGRLPRAWIPLVVGGVAIIIAAGMMTLRYGAWGSWTSGQFGPPVTAFIVLSLLGLGLVTLFWGFGWGVRALSSLDAAAEFQATAETQLADSEIRIAIAEERNRIAQEMHDVLAHSLAVIVAQADGARYLRSKRPAAVDAALLAIAGSARAALTDVGGIIDGVLDGGGAPQPGLADLPDLIGSVEAAGLQVAMTEAGERGALAPGQEVAVYRIVQEGLTNALRHRGPGSSVTIVFDWRGPGLALQLVSSGEGEVMTERSLRGGRGIPGMTERARLAGGWLSAGADDSGDHRLTAFIPYRELAAVAA
jgi:signal transduction histidine kinase